MSLLVGEHPEGAVQDDRGSQEPDQARQEGKTKNRLQKCFFVLSLAGSFLLSCLLHLSSLTKFCSFSSFLFISILVFISPYSLSLCLSLSSHSISVRLHDSHDHVIAGSHHGTEPLHVPGRAGQQPGPRVRGDGQP